VNEVYESQRLEPPMVKKKEVDDRMWRDVVICREKK
jgi:hypothetical protein